MGTILTLATHEVVARSYPRVPTERQELGMAVGKAIDSALSRYSHEHGRGLRPTAGAMAQVADATLTQELQDIDLAVGPLEREQLRAQVADVLRAFRKSEAFGLARPRTRMVLIDERVGVYAQPDYWDGRSRIYEMKSYRAIPIPPAVQLQLRLFQLAFPGFEARLLCVDRHSSPPAVSVVPVAEPTPDQRQSTLELALAAGLELGKPKVLEHMDTLVVRYSSGGPRRPDAV